jgi:hypothetical protein
MSESKSPESETENQRRLVNALRDIETLLDYIERSPSIRLMSWFTETRLPTDMSAPPTIPQPCPYAQFHSRLAGILSRFPRKRPVGSPETDEKQGAQAVEKQADDIAFVCHCRDFLSAIAAPVTAESIRLTDEFIRCRFLKSPEVMPDAWDEQMAQLTRHVARSIARTTIYYLGVTMIAIVVTGVLSIYALTGQSILANQEKTQTAWVALDAEIESMEEKLNPQSINPGIRQVSERAATLVSPLCPDPNSPAINQFVSAQQIHLCDRKVQTLQDLFVVSMHLQSWSGILTAVHNVAWLDFPVSIGPIFGVSHKELTDYANSNAVGTLCAQYSKTNAECKTVLVTFLNRSTHVADAILSSITEYFLPVCYGFLGAMAASLRAVRRKVDTMLLRPTDRAGLHHSALLGVLCGAIVGLLFSSYLGKTSTATSLGISAMALLAGYNIDAVFRFFDALSEKVFQMSPARSPDGKS